MNVCAKEVIVSVGLCEFLYVAAYFTRSSTVLERVSVLKRSSPGELESRSSDDDFFCYSLSARSLEAETVDLVKKHAIMASGPGRGSMALASAALLLLEDARAASQGAPAVRAGAAPSTPGGGGVLGSTGRSPSGTPRGGASARKRRMQEAAAAAEEAVLRKASFAKAKHEIGEGFWYLLELISDGATAF